MNSSENRFDAPFEQSIHIGYSDINSMGQLKIVSILNFLQDLASEHAAVLGMSGFDLARQGFAWVIARYHISIGANPVWREDLQAITWRHPWKNLYELRELTISDRQREPIIHARSAWVMVKRENSRPVRLSRIMPEQMTIEDDADHSSLFKELERPESIDFQLPFKIRMHDLDLNQHVNNAIYVEWAVETVPKSILSQFRPATIDVTFYKESFYGDAIVSCTQLNHHNPGLQSYHSIYKADMTTELARINIDWKPMTIRTHDIDPH